MDRGSGIMGGLKVGGAIAAICRGGRSRWADREGGHRTSGSD